LTAKRRFAVACPLMTARKSGHPPFRGGAGRYYHGLLYRLASYGEADLGSRQTRRR